MNQRRLLLLVHFSLLVAIVATPFCCAWLMVPKLGENATVVSDYVDPAPPNPQSTFETPFRNVKPGVKYLGDAACKTCHASIHESYHQHPMGRSAMLVSDPKNSDQYAESTHPTFTTASRREYRVEQKNGTVVHTETVPLRDGKTRIVTEAVAEIAIGSGHLGKSYLCQREGSWWQTGISWFALTHRWDESPGFTPGRHATRSIAPGCLYCHVNDVNAISGTDNRFREPLLGSLQASIGCERCHGPGELHVSDRIAGPPASKPDTSIVNPKHLEPALRDAVCQQCHLIGASRVTRRGRDIFEYRPGLPLEQFQTIFVKDEESSQKSVGQIEQLRNSRCSIASKGKMSCTSCHNPHVAPTSESKLSDYRQACLTCHQEKSCSAPSAERQKQSDSCVACHMQTGGSSSIPHASVTDHRILRKPAPPSTARNRPGHSPSLLPFHKDSAYRPDSGEQERDRAIALARRMMDEQHYDPAIVREVAAILRTAVDRHRSDSLAWELLSRMVAVQGNWTEAESHLAKALAIAPRDESILRWASESAFAMKQHEKSLEYALRAVEVNPGNIDNAAIVGHAMLELNQTDRAAEVFQKNLDRVPSHAYSRVGLAICTNRKGDSRAARTLLDQAIELEPGRAVAFREWFIDRSK